MYDKEIHRFLTQCMKSGENFGNDPRSLMADFKQEVANWITTSRLNNVSGLEAFQGRDVITGCTQYLDDLHMTRGNRIVVFPDEYRYHERLYGDALRVVDVAGLRAGDELIIALPFPAFGDIHPEMDAILDRCQALAIPVHIDACWYGCSRDIRFDFDHPAIHSVGFSLSKALGLGGNRIGLRFARERWTGPVTIMNDFAMEPQALVWLGLKFVRHFGADFLQNKYGAAQAKVCADFGLVPTKAIHLAMTEHGPVGLRPLLRMLVEA